MSLQAEILEDINGARLLAALKLRLAGQLAHRRWRGPLLQLSSAVEAGQSLEEAIAQQQAALPRELYSLLRESLNVKDPGGMLVDALGIHSNVRASWRAMMGVMVYPAILFLFAVLVGVAFSYCMKNMVSLEWIETFGLSGSESLQTAIVDQHNAILGLGLVSLWTVAILAMITFAGPAWAWLSVMSGAVIFGKPLRWLSLREILYRYRLFLSHGLNTADVAEAVARSFERSSQSTVCRAIADRISGGTPLGKAMSACLLSDGLSRPALLLLDHRGADLPVALEEAASLLGQMAEHRCRTLTTLIPFFSLAMVGTILWASISIYLWSLLPLITAISSLA